MKFVGIDPGKLGALACIDTATSEILIFPYEKGYTEFIKQNQDAIYVIEKVQSFPRDTPMTAFAFGMGYGQILGNLEVYGISPYKVRPQDWKQEFGLTKDKQASINKAKDLYPQVSLLKTPRCSKDSDGCAEALLIAEFARRKGEEWLQVYSNAQDKKPPKRKKSK